MGQYKTIIVRVGGKIPDFHDEMEPSKLNAALTEGYQIKEVHQMATTPAAGGSGTIVVGVVILTYVLYKP